ncbi:MAG: 4-alpha-glucanotransferase [Cyanobacteria bacterium J06642_2]
MPFERASGILLHPTSFPGAFGIGDLGDTAYQFIDFMVESGQTIWQVLPLGTTGYGNSPYMSYSAIAGNPLLVSPERLAAAGWLYPSDWYDLPVWQDIQAQSPGKVDYAKAIACKMYLLQLAFERFQADTNAEPKLKFAQFCQSQAAWLDDYALFMALLHANDGCEWSEWQFAGSADVARRDPAAVQAARQHYGDEIVYHQFVQFCFWQQWGELKRYANRFAVQIMGDIPIYVAYNSADVWSNRELFELDEKGRPERVAGVPPDYFSTTGQLWGNPLYRWDILKVTDYRWWIDRFHYLFELVDIVRIDHFRAFEAYWAVPGNEDTAINGKWIPGPGDDLFEAVEKALGKLPVVAEDLGVITPEVEALRDRFEFPGMKILQFAFGDSAGNPYLTHNYVRNCVVYTGTHDNDTTVGWFYDGVTERGYGSSEDVQNNVRRYLGRQHIDEIHWDFIRLAMMSVADLAIAPLQDVFGLNRDSRMNFPGTVKHNWVWRYTSDMLTDELAHRLVDVTLTYGRTHLHQLYLRRRALAEGTTPEAIQAELDAQEQGD